jgi:hypothetical protein
MTTTTTAADLLDQALAAFTEHDHAVVNLALQALAEDYAITVTRSDLAELADAGDGVAYAEPVHVDPAGAPTYTADEEF